MSETMVERVARAMYARTHDEPWDHPHGEPGLRALYRDDAFTAISALRDPSPAVIEAIARVIYYQCAGVALDRPPDWSYEAARRASKAKIDAIEKGA